MMCFNPCAQYLHVHKMFADRLLPFVVDRLQVERRGQQMHQRSLPAAAPLLLQPGRQCHHRRRQLETTQQPLSPQAPRQRRSTRYDDRTCVVLIGLGWTQMKIYIAVNMILFHGKIRVLNWCPSMTTWYRLEMHLSLVISAGECFSYP